VLQTSQASRKKIAVSPYEKQAVAQKKLMRRGWAVTKGPEPREALSICSKLAGMKHPDTSRSVQEDVPLPPSHTAAVPLPSFLVSHQLEPPSSAELPVQVTTYEHVPRESRPCIDTTPSPFNAPPKYPRPPSFHLSAESQCSLQPSRHSCKAGRLQRGPRRPRHVPKRPTCMGRMDS